MTSQPDSRPAVASPFPGFESFEANFVFCPNQFFDLVIPNHSRPVVRLVSYILHETLKWLDENGQPVRQDIAISFNDLVEKAGIARGSIRKAIGEAVNAKLIKCVVKGKSKQTGEPGRVGEYSLAWDETGHYAKSIDSFAGFYVGQGNRSTIPHSFFTHVIPAETLAVVKVVGTVLRYTVGYQNQIGGGRRREAQLSFRTIHRYARIASPATVAEAIREAISSNYIRRVHAGQFSPNADEQKSTVYSVNWLHDANRAGIGSKSEAGDRFNIRSSKSVQNPKQHQFKRQSSIGSESVAGDRFKKRTSIKNTSNNQQTTGAVAESIDLLMKAGFTLASAGPLASKATSDQVKNQISWLRYRTAKTNRLGLLRKAIEENWPEPTAAIAKRRSVEHWKHTVEVERATETSDFENERDRAEWIKRWFAAPIEFRNQCKLQAISRESNPIVRRRLEQKRVDEPPHPNVMIEFKDSFSLISESAEVP